MLSYIRDLNSTTPVQLQTHFMPWKRSCKIRSMLFN